MGISTSWRRLGQWSAGLGRRGAGRAGEHPGRRSSGADSAHLAGFAAAHPGAEAYLEPPTAVTPLTLLVVAGDGEWTRRQVPDAKAASDFAHRVGIALYDVNLTGYPPRMREWTARQRREAGPRALPS